MAHSDVEDRLIEQLRAGDPCAVEPLMARHAARVYRVATNAALIKRRGKRQGEVGLEDHLPAFKSRLHRARMALREELTRAWSRA